MLSAIYEIRLFRNYFYTRCAVTVTAVTDDSVIHVKHVLTNATRVGTLIVATIYLQLIQNRYMFRSFM